MNSVTITLGGVEYKVAELPARKNSQWRQYFEEKLGPLLALVEQAGGGMAISTSDDLLQIAHQIGRVLVRAPDMVTDLIFAYAPALMSDQERILDEAYDSELIKAFQQILGLAYPFGGLARQLGSLASGSTGSASPTTLKNSPSVNGAKSAKVSMTSDA
ncbi:MAG: hypothetical protein R2932_59315 [Caldilineaceae bacterium]